MAALMLILTSGCFERHTRILLYADGSGELVITTTVQQAYLEYVAGVSGKEDPTKGFSEARLKERSSRYGKGLEYQSHSIHRQKEATRLQVRYRFQDLSGLKIGLDPSLPLLEMADTDQQAPPVYPVYSFHNRGSGQFTIYSPKTDGSAASSVHVRVESDTAQQQQQERLEQERTQWMRYGNPFALQGSETREELIRTLGAGMRFQLELVAMDEITSTTSRYRLKGDRILLYSVELERLLQDPEMKPLLVAPGSKGPRWSDLIRSDKTLIETGRYRLLELNSAP